jgi:hypothetical protein
MSWLAVFTRLSSLPSTGRSLTMASAFSSLPPPSAGHFAAQTQSDALVSGSRPQPRAGLWPDPGPPGPLRHSTPLHPPLFLTFQATRKRRRRSEDPAFSSQPPPSAFGSDPPGQIRGAPSISAPSPLPRPGFCAHLPTRGRDLLDSNEPDGKRRRVSPASAIGSLLCRPGDPELLTTQPPSLLPLPIPPCLRPGGPELRTAQAPSPLHSSIVTPDALLSEPVLDFFGLDDYI